MQGTEGLYRPYKGPYHPDWSKDANSLASEVPPNLCSNGVEKREGATDHCLNRHESETSDL